MDPIQQAAKSGNLTKFRELWYKQHNIDPLKDKTDYNAQIARDMKYYQDGGGTNVTNQGKQSIGTVLLGGAANLAATQEQKGYMADEYIKVNDILKIAINQQGELNDLNTIGRNIIEGGGDQLLQYYQQQSELLGVVNKGMGMTGKLSNDYRETLTEANIELLRYGITFGELTQAAQGLVDATGKFRTLNSETWKEAGVVASAFVGTLSQMAAMYPEFEKIGLGAADTNLAITKAGKDAVNVGLQAKNVTGEINRNLGKLNEYGFKNGVEGLSQMVRKANEFRMSMDSVFGIANKVMDPSSAIDLTANLQALGGAIGDFNDPLKMMYMATNNVEGLQDALVGAAKNLATYNSEQGRFEITGVNLRRAKEMADQFGMSVGELSKISIAAAERTSAASDLMSRGLTLDKDQQEFITNMAQMKGGRMAIEINSEKLKGIFEADTIYLDQMTEEQAKLFKQYQKDFKEATPEEMVKNQATNIENMTRSINYMAAVMRKEAGETGEEVAKAMGIDFSKYSKETQSFADREAPELKKVIGDFKQTIIDFGKDEQNKKGKVGEPKSDQMADQKLKEQNKPTTTPPSQTTPNKSDVTVNIKANDAVVDEFSRFILKNPQYLDMFNSNDPKSYTSTQ